MAKKQRFPSPANQPKVPAAKAAEGPLPEAVSASPQKLVAVEYKKENNHILGIGAHALAKGINHIPAIVWEEAKKHPSVKHLIDAGHAVEHSPAFAKAEAHADEPKEEESEESDEQGEPEKASE